MQPFVRAAMARKTHAERRKLPVWPCVRAAITKKGYTIRMALPMWPCVRSTIKVPQPPANVDAL